MTIRSEGLFGVGLFLMGVTVAAYSFTVLAVATILPALVVFEFTGVMDFVVSITAVVASKRYGKKSLITSSVFSGINTLLRVAAFTLLLFYLFGASSKPFPTSNRTNVPNEDETRTQYELPSDEFPSFAPGSERPPRPHGPGHHAPGHQRHPRPHGPGGPGECPPLPADLPPLPEGGELPPFPGDLPPMPDGPVRPGRPGHCGPGFPGGPGRPGHHGRPGGHEGQDPRDDNEQEPRQGEDEQRQREHQGPRRPGHPGRQENNEQQETSDETNTREFQQDQRTKQSRGPGKKGASALDIGSPFLAWGISIWGLGLNIAIFVLSIIHTRRVFLEGKTSASTTTVNGKVYSELSSKV